MTVGSGGQTILEITGLTKQYAALRPFRLKSLTVAAGERVAIVGMDGAASELFVSLVTGAALPDEGDVRLFGGSTAGISDGDAWLASLERFGIMSPRAILLEAATVAQNLAMPFTLSIDPIPSDVREQVERLAAECGIPAADLERPMSDAAPAVRARAHLARAVALAPALLVLDHPTATIPDEGRSSFAAAVVRICEARSQTMIAATLDRDFAVAVGHRAASWQPSTGVLTPVGRRWWQR
jgi:ABC-type transporter Mla maintaining outer membrane lipid asymmetry ATPase subunit MlaF